MAYKDPEFCEILNSADLLTADGIGVVYASKILRNPVPERVAGYDMACSVIDEIAKYDNPYTYLVGLVVRVTKKIKNVEIIHQEREIGKSGYSFAKLISLWMNGFTAFSVKPLRVSTIFGAIIAILGFIYAILIIAKKIINPQAPIGYSSMMCVMLIIGGCIMLMLGMIGEYLGRMYICMNKSPQYVIRNTINIKE